MSREKSKRKKNDVPRSFRDELLDKAKKNLPEFWAVLFIELLLRIIAGFLRQG